jgi:hypothetical protein
MLDQMINDLKKSVAEGMMTEDEMKTIFFNSNVNDFNLYDYVDSNHIVNTESAVFPVEIKTLTRGDIEAFYNVVATTSMTRNQVLDVLVE